MADRAYFRRTGYKRVPLPGQPGSEPFMEAYQAALGDEPVRTIGAGRSGPRYSSCRRRRIFRLRRLRLAR
jgi:hypothetical protein